MALKLQTSLVSVDWVHEHSTHPDLVVLFSALPKVGTNTSDKAQQFIPNSIEFDVKNQFSKKDAPFPNTMPSEEEFQREVQSLGLNGHHCIVVYDAYGLYSAARVWWMFKSMGFDNIAVIDGGLPAWIHKGYSTVQELKKPVLRGNFVAKFNPHSIVSKSFVLDNLSNPNIRLADARPEGRFYGQTPEPRKEVRSGHIPNSISLPYTKLLSEGKLKSKEELNSIFFSIFSKDTKVVFSCGSGVTACILGLAASVTGNTNFAIYDGSWTEWGSLTELPIEK